MPQLVLSYADARPRIRDADLLMFRRDRRLRSVLIATGSGSVYTHGAMACWEVGEVRCLQMMQWRRGQNVSFFDEVRAFPGQWELYRANAGDAWRQFKPEVAVATMKGFVDKQYGWGNFFSTAALYLPVVRFFVRPNTDDAAEGRGSPMCSDALSRAYRAAGVDPVVQLADAGTTPGHLAHSVFFRFVCSIVP